MNKSSEYDFQETGNEGGQVIADCLKNSVVLRTIFQHLSNRELLRLSTINKMWNYGARLMMRNRGNVVANLTCRDTRPCHQVFRAFAADLQQMNFVPYSGMNIVIHPMSHAVGTEALDPTYEVILARLPLKRFSLRLVGKWWDCKDCPAFALLKNLLQMFSHVLEELTLDIEEKRVEFVRHFVRDCSFSELKVLKLLEKYDTSDELYMGYTKALVKRAPKLKELHTYGMSINLKENVLEEREAVHFHHHQISLSSHEISESVIDTLRLNDVKLLYAGPELNLDAFNQMASILLQAPCAATISQMSVDGILVGPIMGYGICLENVKDLDIYLNYKYFKRYTPHLLKIMKNFDFTRIFPNLEKVFIDYDFEFVQPSSDHMLTIMEQALFVLINPSPNRAAKIKELYLCQKHLSASAVQFFAQMFPDIQKLEIRVDGDEDVSFGSIWKHWPDLKELEVGGKFLQNIENLDSVFCGIFPEEIAQLREMGEEYLKKVNIVPLMPAITFLKNLVSLTLMFCLEESHEPLVDDGTFIFSKVTGLCGFARCPSLAVNLDFTAYGVIPVSHLKPFASVQCVNRRSHWSAQ